MGSTDDDDDEAEEEEGFPSHLCKIFDQKNEMEVMEAVLFDRHLV